MESVADVMAVPGNLPTEKVTKRDIFHLFHKHGKLAQISIKQAYGFVQFLDSGACQRALQIEQGVQIRGRKMRESREQPSRGGTTDLSRLGDFQTPTKLSQRRWKQSGRAPSVSLS